MTTAAPPKTCATPGCEESPGSGKTGRFCPSCAERLSKMREELVAKVGRKYRIYGTRLVYADDNPDQERDDG